MFKKDNRHNFNNKVSKNPSKMSPVLVPESSITRESNIVPDSKVITKAKFIKESNREKPVKIPFQLSKINRLDDYKTLLLNSDSYYTFLDLLFKLYFPNQSPEFVEKIPLYPNQSAESVEKISLFQILVHGDIYLLNLMKNYKDYISKVETSKVSLDNSKKVEQSNEALILRLQKTRIKFSVVTKLIVMGQHEFSSINESYNKIVTALLLKSLHVNFPIEGNQYYTVPILIKTIANKLAKITVELSHLLPDILTAYNLSYEHPFNSTKITHAWVNIAMPNPKGIQPDSYYLLRLIIWGPSPSIMPVEFHKQWGMYHEQVTDLLRFLNLDGPLDLLELKNSIKYNGNIINMTAEKFFNMPLESMSKNTFERLLYVMEQFIPLLYIFVLKYIIKIYYKKTDEFTSRLERLISPANFSLGQNPVINSTEKPEVVTNEYMINGNSLPVVPQSPITTESPVSVVSPVIQNNTNTNIQVNPPIEDIVKEEDTA